jgi:hypothetical protein
MDLFDFSKTASFNREDRWLRFILRLSFVIFVLSIETVVILAVIRLLIK